MDKIIINFNGSVFHNSIVEIVRHFPSRHYIFRNVSYKTTMDFLLSSKPIRDECALLELELNECEKIDTTAIHELSMNGLNRLSIVTLGDYCNALQSLYVIDDVCNNKSGEEIDLLTIIKTSYRQLSPKETLENIIKKCQLLNCEPHYVVLHNVESTQTQLACRILGARDKGQTEANFKLFEMDIDGEFKTIGIESLSEIEIDIYSNKIIVKNLGKTYESLDEFLTEYLKTKN